MLELIEDKMVTSHWPSNKEAAWGEMLPTKNVQYENIHINSINFTW